MTYIKTGIQAPGIVELLFYKTSSGAALSNLAHTLLLGSSPLTPGERELIAAYVSHLNNCEFCHLSHHAAAIAHLQDDGFALKAVLENPDTAPVTEKLKHLLKIAESVQLSGKQVRLSTIDAAKKAGASDEEIHDTVLLAAAFCMFNRYVDGLGTTPAAPHEYASMGERMKKGYKLPPGFLKKLVAWKMKINRTG